MQPHHHLCPVEPQFGGNLLRLEARPLREQLPDSVGFVQASTVSAGLRGPHSAARSDQAGLHRAGRCGRLPNLCLRGLYFTSLNRILMRFSFAPKISSRSFSFCPSIGKKSNPVTGSSTFFSGRTFSSRTF